MFFIGWMKVVCTSYLTAFPLKLLFAVLASTSRGELDCADQANIDHGRDSKP